MFDWLVQTATSTQASRHRRRRAKSTSPSGGGLQGAERGPKARDLLTSRCWALSRRSARIPARPPTEKRARTHTIECAAYRAAIAIPHPVNQPFCWFGRNYLSLNALAVLTMGSETIEGRLAAILERVLDSLKYVEAKNVALVTLNGVGAGFLATWLSAPNPTTLGVLGSGTVPATAAQRLAYVLKPCLGGLLISILLGLVSFYPQLRIGWVHECFAWRRRWILKRHKDAKLNVLYFSHIAGARAGDYVQELQAATGERSPLTPTKLAVDCATEIVANAESTLVKVWVFRGAFFLTFVAYSITCLAIFGDQIWGAS